MPAFVGSVVILFQKDKNGRSSILQAGSTSLKHAQVRWAIPELELLAVKYMLNKCHFYMAWATKTIIVYSDCKGLKHYQTRDILDIDNHRLFMITSDLMTYDYEIRHIKGETKCIADGLSHHPAWLTGKDKGSDCNQGPTETGHHGPRDKLCLRVFTESRHILRDNPALRQLEEIGQKDEDYKTMIQFIKANKSFRDLPTSSEGARMGGEWPKLEILDEFEVIVLRETDTVSKIFPPRQYRPLILKKLHESGRKEDSVFLRTHLHYTWPTIHKDVKNCLENCQNCRELMPSKSQATSSGLPVSIENL